MHEQNPLTNCIVYIYTKKKPLLLLWSNFHSLFGQVAPVLSCPYIKYVFLVSSWNLPRFNLRPLSLPLSFPSAFSLTVSCKVNYWHNLEQHWGCSRLTKQKPKVCAIKLFHVSFLSDSCTCVYMDMFFPDITLQKSLWARPAC